MKTILSMVAVVLGLVIWALLTTSADAGTFRKVNDHVVSFTGAVVDNDHISLQNYLDSNPETTTITLSSDGGNAMGGYRLGYRIKANELRTVVPVDKACLSACATAFLAGSEKSIFGILGFHVAWIQGEQDTNEALKQGQLLGSVNSEYLFNVGYRNQLATLVSQVTSSDTFFVFKSTLSLDFFKMEDNNFASYFELPKNFVSDRLAGPFRLHLMKQGY